ncbi:MAG: DNA-3-methyladenine glycosylase [bacterium]
MKANEFSTVPGVAVLLGDARFAPLVQKYGAPDREKRKDPFHSLVRSIVYQQVSGKAAASILAKYLLLFPGATKTKPPSPEAVVKTQFETLRSAGLSGQKASYILDAAQKFADGTITPKKLLQMTNEEAILHLTQIKGVGVWTAQMFLMSTLGRPDVLPTGDLGIQKGFQIVYGLKKLPDHKKMEQLAKPWRAHASAACHYLWRVADEAKEVKILKNPAGVAGR